MVHRVVEIKDNLGSINTEDVKSIMVVYRAVREGDGNITYLGDYSVNLDGEGVSCALLSQSDVWMIERYINADIDKHILEISDGLDSHLHESDNDRI